jgi:hypothetical protein
LEFSLQLRALAHTTLAVAVAEQQQVLETAGLAVLAVAVMGCLAVEQGLMALQILVVEAAAAGQTLRMAAAEVLAWLSLPPQLQLPLQQDHQQ